MVITVVLGNGFDIGLGLRTQYHHFIKDYIKPRVEDTDLISLFRSEIAREISEDVTTWADAELKFGRLPFSEYASKLGMAIEDTFLRLDAHIQESLADYLRHEESRFCIPTDKFAERRKRLVFSVWHSVAYAWGIKRHSLFLNRADREGCVINFITLNYTRTLNKFLLDLSGQGGEIVGAQTPAEKALLQWPKSLSVGRLVYAHGSLMDRYRLFGVDGLAQIADEQVKALCRKNCYLVKTLEDRHAEVGNREEAVKCLSDSDYVMLFGLSYGETDSIWWRYITGLLEQKRIDGLVLCPYVDNPSRANVPAVAMNRSRRERERFFKGVDSDRYIDLAERYEAQIAVLDYGPVKNAHGELVYCDPLGLRDVILDCPLEEVSHDHVLRQIDEVQKRQKESFVNRTEKTFGRVSFDFSRNDGCYMFEIAGCRFNTRWSECGARSIYCIRKDGRIGLLRNATSLPNSLNDPARYDWTTSHSCEMRVGDVVLVETDQGRVLALRIVNICVVSRGGVENKLSLEYRLLL